MAERKGVVVMPPAQGTGQVGKQVEGRKSKLTPEVLEQIVQAVAAGVPFAQACVLMGVQQSTGLMWRQQGEGRHPTRPGNPLHVEFAEAVQRAEAQDEARRVARISRAAQGGEIIYEKTVTFPDGRVQREVKRAVGQWTADAWLLERTRPDRYSKRTRLDLRVPMQEVLKRVAEETGLTPEELLIEAERLAGEG